MVIKPVDMENRLFSIEHFLPDELAALILDIPWDTIPWKRGEQQESWARRQLDFMDHKVVHQFNDRVLLNKIQIEKELGIKFDYHPFTMWWYDEPGFTVATHTDGHLPSSMQIYWNADSDMYGTTFFEYKNTNTVKHRVTCRPNFGYLMLNGPNDDGSQPLQWHGMLTPVQKFRVSSYTNFGTYVFE
jgi:hypothetical protein